MILTISLLILVIAVIVFLCISFYIAIFGGGPFVPTPMHAVQEILKTANIKKGDRLYDIGAGDGRFLHIAETKYKARAIGFEIDPFVYFLAKIRQWFFKWKGTIIRADFQKHNISDADIVICYMLPKTLAKFQKKFDQELTKGTKIISYAFHIGDWKPKKIIPKSKKLSQIFVYEIA